MFPISYGVCKALEDAKRKTIEISIVQLKVDENKVFFINIDKQTSFVLKQPH